MKATMLALVLGVIVGAWATPVAAQFGPPPPPADPNAPMPKLANGKPDLSGSWQAAGGGQQGSGGDMFRRCTPFQSKNCMEWTNQSEDWPFMSATRLDQRQPLYKPEHWDKIIELDQWTNKYDPVMTCLPLGVPRQGPPARIFQTDKDITMIYRGGGDGGGGYAEFRMIPVDGKPHDPQRATAVHVHGVHGRPLGRRHAGPRLHRVLRRDLAGARRLLPLRQDAGHREVHAEGNEILYEVTIEDPEVLVKPWVMPARTLRLSSTNAIVAERGSCGADNELKEVATQFRH